MKKVFITLICFLCIAGSCFAETVSFNVKTHKIHNSSCRYFNCKSCIKIERKDAIKRGGVPCKVCGG